MTESAWWRFVEGLIGDDNAQEAAARAGFSKSNFTRWKQGARADPDFVVKLVRAYNGSVLDGLVASGFLTADEADVRIEKQRVSELPDSELAYEMLRRAKAREAGFDSTERYEVAAEAVAGFGYDEEWLRQNWRQQRHLILALMSAYEQGERDSARVHRAIQAAEAWYSDYLMKKHEEGGLPPHVGRHSGGPIFANAVLRELGLSTEKVFRI